MAARSDNTLRNQILRLAHAHPEFRKDLLPLITAQDESVKGKYEKGVPADPTENMTPEDKAEWESNNDKYKDKFTSDKEATLRSRLIRLAKNQPEFRKAILPLLRSKKAGMATVRLPMAVRVIRHTVSPEGQIYLSGQISLDLAGGPSDVRFTATVSIVRQSFVVVDLTTNKPASGAGGAILDSLFRTALSDALAQRGGTLIGDVGEEVTIPTY